MTENKQLFFSFMMGGFECSFHRDRLRRLDILADSKHELYLQEDYTLLKEIGIHTVREGLAWYQVDKGNGIYDFSRFEKIMQQGSAAKIQQIWDLNHFDFPENLNPYTNEFIDRFAAYAKAVILLLRKFNKGTIFIVPFNEISFFSWIAGEIGEWAPFTTHKGFLLKTQCVKAVLAAIDEVRKIDKNVQFIHADPIMHRVPKKKNCKIVEEYAQYFEETRFQVWDMISGKIMPELGGDPSYLDIIGINYYLHNQEYILHVDRDPFILFQEPVCRTIPFNSQKREKFSSLCYQIHNRYKKPILISETGCFGSLRKIWWRKILTQVEDMLNKGLPILGVCAYPIIDRHDWVNGSLTNSGLWDFREDDIHLNRYAHTETIRVIEKFILNLKLKNHVSPISLPAS